MAALSLIQTVQADVSAGLAALAQQNYATAKKEFETAAEQGSAEAQYSLAQLYENGQGVPQDYGQALQWNRKAAEQGLDLAQNNLGFMYENAQGTSQNYAEAVKWYNKAADQDYAIAQFNLGRIYATGLGVLQDDVQAYFWTALSASQGDEGAQNNIKLLAARMSPAQISEAKELILQWSKQHSDLIHPHRVLPDDNEQQLRL